IARDMVDPERITVIDSRSASVGQGLTVIRAAQAIAAGKSKQEVIAEIENNISRIQHIFIVGNLEMLKRGGRINPTAAALGDFLNIKLVLHFVDGRILPLEKVHGLKKAKKRLLDIIENRGDDIKNQTIGISYSKDIEGALEIKQMIEERFGSRDFVISEIGALIGTHVGAGTYSVFFLSK
ncbi:MAG: DegV family protein, partial [Syntrophomonas sp.]